MSKVRNLVFAVVAVLALGAIVVGGYTPAEESGDSKPASQAASLPPCCAAKSESTAEAVAVAETGCCATDGKTNIQLASAAGEQCCADKSACPADASADVAAGCAAKSECGSCPLAKEGSCPSEGKTVAKLASVKSESTGECEAKAGCESGKCPAEQAKSETVAAAGCCAEACAKGCEGCPVAEEAKVAAEQSETAESLN